MQVLEVGNAKFIEFLTRQAAEHSISQAASSPSSAPPTASPCPPPAGDPPRTPSPATPLPAGMTATGEIISEQHIALRARLLDEKPTAREFFDQMIALYPGRLNPSPVWYGALGLLGE